MTRRPRAGALLVAVALTAAAMTSAAPDPGAYTDIKQRFRLALPHGWELAPMPGDVEGMVFRRTIGEVPALFRAAVTEVRVGESLATACDRVSQHFAAEIGYRGLGDTATTVAGMGALRRTHTAYAAGDERLVRYAIETVFFAYGHLHHLHFETLEHALPSFQRDLHLLLERYQPLAGQALYAPLLGEWATSAAGAPARLSLRADLSFQRDGAAGTFLADGKQLTLVSAAGRQTFDYVAGETSLVLRGANLSNPLTYRRTSPPSVTAAPTEEPRRPPRGEALVGRWRVVDGDLQLLLSPSGSVQFGPLSGTYRVKGRLLTITSAAGVEETYTISLHRGRLRLSGGDLERPLELRRE